MKGKLFMSFGSELQSNFHRLTQNHLFNEEILFAKLDDAFILMKKKPLFMHHIDIIHGDTSKIQFDLSYDPIFGKPIIRELADMLFILISKKEMRIMYLQNKRQSELKPRLCFNAEYGQFQLLKERPHIEPAFRKGLPTCVFNNKDILCDAILPSVCSYGVFYCSNGEINMFYFPASQLSVSGIKKPTGRRTHVDCKLKFDSKFGFVDAIHGHLESQGEKDLESFGNALIRMTVGTPVSYSMRAQVCDYLSFCSENHNNENSRNLILGCKTVIVIHTDNLAELSNETNERNKRGYEF